VTNFTVKGKLATRENAIDRKK